MEIRQSGARVFVWLTCPVAHRVGDETGMLSTRCFFAQHAFIFARAGSTAAVGEGHAEILGGAAPGALLQTYSIVFLEPLRVLVRALRIFCYKVVHGF